MTPASISFDVLTSPESEAKIFRLIVSVVRNEDDARELLNDVYLRAWQVLQAGQTINNGWVVTTARNLASNRRRDNLQDRQIFSASIDDPGFDVLSPDSRDADLHDSAGMIEVRRAEVRRAVNQLSDGLRAATILFYFHGLSCKEIATALNITEASTRRRLHDARKALESILAPATERKSA